MFWYVHLKKAASLIISAVFMAAAAGQKFRFILPRCVYAHKYVRPCLWTVLYRITEFDSTANVLYPRANHLVVYSTRAINS